MRTDRNGAGLPNGRMAQPRKAVGPQWRRRIERREAWRSAVLMVVSLMALAIGATIVCWVIAAVGGGA